MFRGEGPPVQNPELRSAWYSDDQTWLVKLGPWAVGQGAWQVGGLIMKGLTSLVKGFLTWKNWRVVGEQGKSHTHFGLNVPKIQVVELYPEPLVNWTYKTTYMLASVAGTLSLSLFFFFFFFGNCKRQKSQEIKHNRCFHFCLVTSAHQRNQSCCVCPMNASLNFHFHGNISRDNQKVEQAGFVGHNHWSNFIFVWRRPLKIHWVEGILPVLLVESSAILTIFWSL